MVSMFFYQSRDMLMVPAVRNFSKYILVVYLYCMDKKEKYYNYVVNDIVKNTEIYHDKKRIKFPFYSFFLSPSSSLLVIPFSSSSTLTLPYTHLFFRFSKHVIERYGVHDEEMRIIWNQYREKILTIIGNG